MGRAGGGGVAELSKNGSAKEYIVSCFFLLFAVLNVSWLELNQAAHWLRRTRLTVF